MDTPLLNFLREYNQNNMLRFHMPGHKGKTVLGMENLDITEVSGADSLYEASGVIARSEAEAGKLFGSQASFYSTEGSSQCIRAMLHLIMQNRKEGQAPIILAARNVHKSFVYAAALLDIQVRWLRTVDNHSVCSCPVDARTLENELDGMAEKPAAVYITSPDYLGHMADIKALADVCHRCGVLLAVDNAHGAYLHFLKKPMHPLDLGADICCDSAHKTLPVLTGGAYLHIGRSLPEVYAENAKSALALFGSTSPSYLIMASLDACNLYLAESFSDELDMFCGKMETLKLHLSRHGWFLEDSDPMRLTLRTDGFCLANMLRSNGMEPEYADSDFIVMMLSPQNTNDELAALEELLLSISPVYRDLPDLGLGVTEQYLSIRDAILSPTEIIPVREAIGRICAAPMVSCPPAIPIIISGERIDEKAVCLFEYYKIDKVEVVKVPVV